MLGKFINAINVPYVPTKFLGFDDVGIMPYTSPLTGANDPLLNLESRVGNYNIGIPIIFGDLSPDTKFSDIAALKTFGFIESNGTAGIDSLISALKSMSEHIVPSFTIGTHPSDSDIVGSVLEAGIKKPQILITSNNGESRILLDQIRKIKAKYQSDVDISVGFPQTIQTVIAAVSLGANNIVVGDNLSSCNIPDITKIYNIRHGLYASKNNATITAVVSNHNHFCKAIVAGADAIMIYEYEDWDIPKPLDLFRDDMYMSGASKISDLFNKTAFFELG